MLPPIGARGVGPPPRTYTRPVTPSPGELAGPGNIRYDLPAHPAGRRTRSRELVPVAGAAERSPTMGKGNKVRKKEVKKPKQDNIQKAARK